LIRVEKGIVRKGRDGSKGAGSKLKLVPFITGIGSKNLTIDGGAMCQELLDIRKIL
jgi:hypothetical protein